MDSELENWFINDESSSTILDHRRLYVTNVPSSMTVKSLETMFTKYGPLDECFLSSGPKKYGLIRYQSATVARHAMTDLHNKEPLRLKIHIAKKAKVFHYYDSTYNSTLPDVKMECGPLLEDPPPQGPKYKNRSSQPFERLNNGESSDGSYNNRRKINAGPRNRESFHEVPDSSMNESRGSHNLSSMNKRAHHDNKVNGDYSNCSPMDSNRSRPTSERSFFNDSVISVEAKTIRDMESEINSDYSDQEFDVDIKKLKVLEAQIQYKQRLRELHNVAKKNQVRQENSVCKLDCILCGADMQVSCKRCRAMPYCSNNCMKEDFADHQTICTMLVEKRKKYGFRHTDSNINEATSIPPLRQPRAVEAEREFPRQSNGPVQGTMKYQPVGSKIDNVKSYKTDRQNNHKNYNDNNKQQGTRWNARPDMPRRPKTQPDVSAQFNADDDEDDWNNVKSTAETSSKPVNQEPVVPKVQAPVEPKVQAPVETKKQAPVETKVQETVEKPKPVIAKAAPKTDALTPLVPAHALIEVLQLDKEFILYVEVASEGFASNPGGIVCLTLHEDYSDNYQLLFDEFGNDCVANKDDLVVSPVPGETYSLYISEEGAWYRARCLGDNRAALIDAARIVTGTNFIPLKEKFARIPEFTCEVQNRDFKVGDKYICTLKKSVGSQFEVELKDFTNKSVVGTTIVSRWLPAVSNIATIPRPDITDKMKVSIVDVTQERICVMSLDGDVPKRHGLLHDVAVYGKTAPILTSPPKKGELVIAKFTDGVHYRAVCLRTNVAKNKYLLDYVDYGNKQTTTLEMLSPCPAKYSLSAEPAQSIIVRLGDFELTDKAINYLDTLKDKPLQVTLPDGVTSVPSGSEVSLILIANNAKINDKAKELSTPEWKKEEELGMNVIDSKVLMMTECAQRKLPATGEFRILDAHFLSCGRLAVCQVNDPLLNVVRNLSARLKEYCESKYGGKSYLPRMGELCIVKSPAGDWMRAGFLEQEEIGSSKATVVYLDTGLVDVVAVKDIRKMVSEFVEDIPPLACDVFIKGFPEDAPPEMVEKAMKFLNIKEDLSSGSINLINCNQVESDTWFADVPGLLAAIQ